MFDLDKTVFWRESGNPYVGYRILASLKNQKLNARSAEFGVMVRLAMLGSDFEPDRQDHHVFQSLAVVLAVSRLVLAFQYSIVLREVWNYKNSKLPLSLLVGSNFVATFVYFGTSLSVNST